MTKEILNRRKALLRMGSVAIAAYAVPTVATLTSAHAKKGESSGPDDSPSPASEPSAASEPSSPDDTTGETPVDGAAAAEDSSGQNRRRGRGRGRGRRESVIIGLDQG